MSCASAAVKWKPRKMYKYATNGVTWKASCVAPNVASVSPCVLRWDSLSSRLDCH